MSRSYKKHPITGNCKTVKGMKSKFNRIVRRIPIDMREGVSAIADGNAYRKLNETWDICEGKSYCTFEDSCFESLFQYRKVFYCK